MNPEEKAVNDCLNDEINVFAGAYDELEDDFIMMLNDGKPALELINSMPAPPMLDNQHENAGVQIIKEIPGEEGSMGGHMIPNYKEQMADVVAMLDKQKEIRKAAEGKTLKEAQASEKEAVKAVNQKALDQVFN
jgi:hypothetical protein